MGYSLVNNKVYKWLCKRLYNRVYSLYNRVNNDLFNIGVQVGYKRARKKLYKSV